MEGLGHAIELIRGLAVKAASPQILKAPDGERAGAYYVVTADGRIEGKMTAPAWHNERLDTPTELLAFVERYAERPEVGEDSDTEGDADSNAAVFYDERGVVYVRDIEDRRDIAKCVLVKSPQFAWLEEKGGGDLSQVDLIRALRITFRGCQTDGGALLGLLKQLRFDSAGTVTTNYRHGSEAMGKSINAEIGASVDIPEETTLNLNVFANFVHPVDVACAIELVPSAQKFRLTPYPLELKRAMDATLQAIAEALSANTAGVPVFRGSRFPVKSDQ